jgi:ribosomal-protein-alanine N-acetyltransferase
MAWADGEISAAGGADVDRAYVRAQFVSFCTRGFATILVAEVDGLPAGWGAREDSDNYVSDLWIAPGFQRRGIGGALLDRFETDIAEAGYATAELETAAANAGGIRFYERHGYRQVWRQVKFSSGLDRDVEKVRLVKPLRPRQD